MSKRAKSRRSHNRAAHLRKRASGRTGYTLPGIILKRVQLDLATNGIESIVKADKSSYPPICLVSGEVFAIAVRGDQIVITPQKWNPCWKIERVKLANPDCFKIIVEKAQQLNDFYNNQKVWNA